MPSRIFPGLPIGPAAPRHWTACALALLLAACGGGGEEATSEFSDGHAGTEIVEPSSSVDDRSFALWSPAELSAIQSEQREIEPGADGSEVNLIVRLNPAAVMGGNRAALASPVVGESGDAAALRASHLAAKVSAVASTANTVLSQSVLRLAPKALVKQQFSHVVEAFVIAVPWTQAEAVAAELARNPAVDSVEPERSFSVGQTTATVRTLDSRAWGVDRVDQHVRTFDSSFRQSLRGQGVNVFVLDTGVSAHNEFGTRLQTGFSAIQDGRGTTDCHGHGTHVAATAAGASFGVAPAAKVVPVRVLDCRGSGGGSQLLAGLDWVAAHGPRPGVVNMSLGGAASATFDAAVQRLVNAGLHVVVAAGNSNVDACTQSPARAAGVVTVAASDRSDAKASFSNWGSCVALWAPGSAIAAAGHTSPTAVVTMSGTSMAAPHAAGAAALLLEAAPTLTPLELRERLIAKASANTVVSAPANTTRSLLFAGLDDGSVPSTQPPAAPVTPRTVVTVRTIGMTSAVPSVGAWTATAAITVVNAAGTAVPHAKVSGRFSNMSTALSCTTNSAGVCNMNSSAAAWSAITTIGFAITDVQGSTLTYAGGGARTAQVARPVAPTASISALQGTLVRAASTSATWKPQFVATLKDTTGKAVAGAVVQTSMQIHAGARVAGTQSASCITGATGQCTIGWAGPELNATYTGARLQVTGVQRTYLTYKAGAVTTATVGRIQ